MSRLCGYDGQFNELELYLESVKVPGHHPQTWDPFGTDALGFQSKYINQQEGLNQAPLSISHKVGSTAEHLRTLTSSQEDNTSRC